MATLLRRLPLVIAAVAAAIASTVIVTEPRSAHATSFFVNSTADTDDGTCDFTNCTLREAINASNATPNVQFIQFGPSGSPPFVITPTSALPHITDQVVVDGTATPGWAQHVPAVEIDGSTAGPEQTHGLVFAPGSDDSLLLGLSIYDFPGAGVRLESDHVQVLGNLLGTNAAQDPGHANIIGLQILGPNNWIGDGTPAGRNIISGNSFSTFPPSNGFGIYIYGSSAEDTLVMGNYIGVKRDGATALANTYGVINFDADGTWLYDNVISGNERGVHLTGSGFARVQANNIGLNAAKTAFIPNTVSGVSATVRTGVSWIYENEIRGNGGPGVWISSGSNQQDIFTNIIDDNAGLGIDLGPLGVLPNDLDDADTGDNGLQNYPVITGVTSAPDSTTIQTTLNSTPSTSFAVNFYASTYCDSSGHGEGFRYLGSHFPVTDAGGDVSFTAHFATDTAPGSSITATASGPTGASEFSLCFDIPLPPEDDQDFDGCQNGEEIGPDKEHGGLRDPENPWDFYDINGSQKVDSIDIGLVRSKFNQDFPAYDRSPGAAPWAPNGPDGIVNGIDVGLVRTEFNHDCTPDI